MKSLKGSNKIYQVNFKKNKKVKKIYPNKK